jgi:thiopeptide-type bacteriocin biosynthesis protein
MKLFDFVQFRIAGGELSLLFDTDFNQEFTLRQSLFLEALKDASPEFYIGLNGDKLDSKQTKTLYKYFSRWCTRSTPFGKFSGVLTADLTDNTFFGTLRPNTFSDLDVVERKLLSQQLSEEALFNSVLYLNTSLYKLGSSYTLLQFLEGKYCQITIEGFNLLDDVINTAGSGVSFVVLKDNLIARGTSEDDAVTFIKELIDEQVLTTGAEFLNSETIEAYLKRQNKALIPERRSYVFTQYPDGELDRRVVDEVLVNISKLGKLLIAPKNLRLEKFKDEFLRRYDGAETPLLRLLDPEHGIPYGENSLSPQGDILVDLNSPAKEQNVKGSLPDFLLDKFIACVKEGKEVISLSEEDLKSKDEPLENSTAYIFGSFFKMGDAHKFHLKSYGGSTGISLMSRFSLGNESLAKRLGEITAYEQSISTSILAEVIHLPEGKSGNVVLHDKLRDYHIAYLGHEQGDCIPASDLMVSMVAGEVILRSKKYNKRILPKLSHAYNYTTGLPIYCFLGDLQACGAQFIFDWGFLSGASYLPRVVFNNLILSRQEWNLTKLNFKALEKSLARYIVIVEGDNELFLDLEQNICKEILQDYVWKKDAVKVQEFLHRPENCFANGHVTEVVIPVKGKGFSEKILDSSVIDRPRLTFLPGSQWLYFKLYMGPKTADVFLRDRINSLVDLLKKEGFIQKWFFIRYQDPNHHLRLRFYHGSNPHFYTRILEAFHAICGDEIQDVQLNSYKPEYDRYTDMEEAENLFMQDSELVLSRLESDEELYRLETSLRQINDFLSVLSLPDKIEFCLAYRNAFLVEFGEDLKSVLNKKYRQNFNVINHILSNTSKTDSKVKNIAALPSYIHMHVNRNFIRESRKYEMTLYHFLFRYYTFKEATGYK